jgi:hypothetical protein
MNVYFISGMGADERAFGKLTLPQKWNCIYLGWPDFLKEDTVESYAKKYIPLIDTSKEFILVGLSFGGMIVTELAKTLKPKKTILISSIYSRSQMSNLMKFSRATNIHKLIPGGIIKIIPDSIRMQFTKRCVGTANEDEIILIKDYMRKYSPRFMKWALHAILNWKNETKPENIYQINGSGDLVFPSRHVRADKMINDGGHFMVYSMANKISEVLAHLSI